MSTPIRPTVLDYLLRAGDAFIEALELYGPAATAADEARVALRQADAELRASRRRLNEVTDALAEVHPGLAALDEMVEDQ